MGTEMGMGTKTKKDKDEDENNNGEDDEKKEDCSHGLKQCKMHHIKHIVVRMSADLASCKYISKSCYM